MTSLANFDIQKHNDETTKSIKNLNKPLSSFNFYIKEMREKWNYLNEEEKDKYILRAKADNQRLAGEKQVILDKSKEEIKKLKIFLIQTTGRVPCVGLDNGFSSYTVIGPMDAIELFTEEEKKKLEAKGVSPNDIGKYKTINGIKFNWRAAKKYGVKVYGGNTNNNNTWWGLRENYEGTTGNFTTYNNYKGESWTENY
jgi:hypothetical protein